MTFADGTLLVAPAASGVGVATWLVGGKVHQAFALVDEAGHIAGTAPTYALFVPAAAVGANKVFFDLFNATGSGKALRVRSVEAVKDGSVAHAGVLAVKLFLTRTSAVGTGGVVATADAAVLTAPTVSKLNPADVALPAQVTSRAAPTAGATAGAVLFERQIFTEETIAASYGNGDGEFLLPGHSVRVPENTGLRVVQGPVAGTGNLGFRVVFEAI